MSLRMEEEPIALVSGPVPCRLTFIISFDLHNNPEMLPHLNTYEEQRVICTGSHSQASTAFLVMKEKGTELCRAAAFWSRT